MNSEKGFKHYWNKFWFVVWKDNSVRGWIFSIIFIFVVIKFIFFPLLNLVTGTSLPLAIVESCSMYHDGNLFSNFDDWWERHDAKYSELGIEKSDFDDYKFKNGFNKGDILFIVGVNVEGVEVGDVIIFEANRQNPLIHRVISITENSETGDRIFSTIGDNNNGQLPVEKSISSEQIVGKAISKPAPYVGWAKLIFFEFSRNPAERGFCNEN
jgi:signal peptidase I